jgi:hypothetical protein
LERTNRRGPKLFTKAGKMDFKPFFQNAVINGISRSESSCLNSAFNIEIIGGYTRTIIEACPK